MTDSRQTSSFSEHPHEPQPGRNVSKTTKPILIIESDPEVQKLLSTSIAEEGYNVFVEHIFSRVVGVINNEKPGLILSTHGHEGAIIQQLFRHMESNVTARIPFFALSPVDPARQSPDEIAATLQQAKGICKSLLPLPRQPSPDSQMSGRFADGRLPEILQFLAQHSKSGVLTVRAPKVGAGHISIKDGEICGAAVEHATGRDAVHQMLMITSGVFDFASDEDPPSQELHLDTFNAVLDSLKVADERFYEGKSRLQEVLEGLRERLKALAEAGASAENIAEYKVAIDELGASTPKDLADLEERFAEAELLGGILTAAIDSSRREKERALEVGQRMLLEAKMLLHTKLTPQADAVLNNATSGAEAALSVKDGSACANAFSACEDPILDSFSTRKNLPDFTNPEMMDQLQDIGNAFGRASLRLIPTDQMDKFLLNTSASLTETLKLMIIGPQSLMQKVAGGLLARGGDNTNTGNVVARLPLSRHLVLYLILQTLGDEVAGEPVIDSDGIDAACILQDDGAFGRDYYTCVFPQLLQSVGPNHLFFGTFGSGKPIMELLRDWNAAHTVRLDGEGQLGKLLSKGLPILNRAEGK